MKILFCGAHPDDAEIYMFGTLLAYRAAGAEVTLVVACSGDGGSSVRSPHQPLAETRQAEAEKGAAVLGARLAMLGYADMSLTENRLRLAGHLQGIFTVEAPDAIFTHAPGDYHADHRALSAAVSLAACGVWPVIHADTMKGVDFQPTHYVDITRHLDAKLRAIHLHHSQMPRRYMLAARDLATRRGREATGGDTARMEAFRVVAGPHLRNARRLFPPRAIAAQTVTMTVPAGSLPSSGTFRVTGGGPARSDPS